jgi:hypothetical protein
VLIPTNLTSATNIKPTGTPTRRQTPSPKPFLHVLPSSANKHDQQENPEAKDMAIRERTSNTTLLWPTLRRMKERIPHKSLAPLLQPVGDIGFDNYFTYIKQ